MDSMKQTISLQHAYFKTQDTKSLAFRKQQLTKLYHYINTHIEVIEEALYKDLGKPPFEAYSTEIGYVLSSISYALKHIKKWMKPKKTLSPFFLFGSYDSVSYVPYGISLIIAPFNYPFQLAIEPLIGAIAAGNTIIMKPSENAPHIAAFIHKMIDDLYTEEYIACFEGGKETTIALTHSAINHIFFTGSIEVGKSIMQAASQRLIPITLELGGKSPVVIDESADLEAAVKRIVWAKGINAGQTCIAPDYLIIQAKLKTRFIELWKKYAPAFKEHQASIINLAQFRKLTQPLDQANIYAGGHFDEAALSIELTLLNGEDSPYMESEIFGPILPILTYHDFSEIFEMVEKHPNPLAFYIFSNNKAHIHQALQRIPFGGGCVNDCINQLISHKVPFGGIGSSGLGQYHGKDSFIAFSHIQTIHHRIIKKELISLYPPYSKKLYQLTRKVMK